MPSFTALQPLYDFAIDAMDHAGEVLVSELRSTVADDDVGVGSVANRCLPSGVIQTSHFKRVTTVLSKSEPTVRLPSCFDRGV